MNSYNFKITYTCPTSMERKTKNFCYHAKDLCSAKKGMINYCENNKTMLDAVLLKI